MKVCIIGSGIAGLYSAYLLRNYDVTLFEKNKIIGGRIKTVKFDSQKVVAGAGVGRKSDVLLKKLCDELKVKTTEYEAKSSYVGIVPEFSPVEKIEELAALIKPKDRRKSFREVAVKYMGLKDYNKFVSYVGETDYEEGGVNDVIKDYGFEESFSSGFTAFSINWDDFLYAFEKRLRCTIHLNKNIKTITKKKKKFEVDGELFDIVIIATTIDHTKKLLDSLIDEDHLSLYDNISCQSFTRLYVKLNRPLDISTRLVITKAPFQKIIEINRDKCLYMISYSDNEMAEFWKDNKDNIDYIVEKKLKEIFKESFSVLKSKLIYWKCGTHFYRPLPEGFRDRDEFLEIVQNPLPNLYCVGEAFSTNQGWCEGALESVEAVLSLS